MMLHPIRTLTFGIADTHPLSSHSITHAAALLQAAQARFTNEGFEVQTVRLSTRSLFTDLADWSHQRIIDYTNYVQQQMDDVNIAFCSLGTLQPATAIGKIDEIADILIASHALSMTAQLATLEHGIREEGAYPIARVMQKLAYETEEGFGNFRFAMLACVAPGSPFFPSAYHDGPGNISIGLQGAGIVLDAITRLRQEEGISGPLPLVRLTSAIQQEFHAQVEPIVRLGNLFATENALLFGGIDLSPAPMGEDSIVAALEQCGYGQFGAEGTLAVVSAVTAALKRMQLPTCGYNGLMLPVLEDAVLGQRWAQGRLSAHQLLLYSAVCGTGLDTLPLPASTPIDEIAHLLLDVATLAVRLRKPLSARLFPIPNIKEGAYTTFRSPYLVNTKLRRLS